MTRRASACSTVRRPEVGSRRSASSTTSSARLNGARRRGDDRHRAHALGDARPGHRAERPPARGRRSRRARDRPQRHHREPRGAAEALLADGERFTSDTDAEVVAHLVRRAYRGCLVEAVRARLRAGSRVTSRSSPCTATSPDLLVGARRQCPLLVGMGDGETFLASSITAFSATRGASSSSRTTRSSPSPPSGVRVIDDRRRGADARSIDVPWDDETPEKNGYETFMLKEIHEQPDGGHRHARAQPRARGSLRPRRRSRARSCAGSSAWRSSRAGPRTTPGLVGALRDRGVGRASPASVEVASEWRYRDPLIDDGHARDRDLPVR